MVSVSARSSARPIARARAVEEYDLDERHDRHDDDEDRVDDLRRSCALPDCDRLVPTSPGSLGLSRTNRFYCCDGHRSLACVRRRRARLAEGVPALLSGAICPVDGRVFPIEMFTRRRGRPRRYDCETCRMIAKEMRECEKLMAKASKPSSSIGKATTRTEGSRSSRMR